MYTVRLIAVFLIILAIVVAYNPVGREQMSEVWQTIRPTVVEFMDGLYATVRNLIAGNGHENHIDDTPSSPGVNFERIVTMSGGASSS